MRLPTGADALATLHVGKDGRTQWLLLDEIRTEHLGFAIRALPGKGFGVIATRRFSSGERIIVEQPLVYWHSKTGDDGEHDWAELDGIVSSLCDTDRRAFFGLCDKHADQHGHAKTAHGIWNSNSFPTEDVMGDGLAAARDGVQRSAVYRLCSRINHACRPSCFAAWSAALGQQTVHALRDVAPGEELSIAYVGGAEAGVRESRQRLLRDKYHFDCTCDVCCLQGASLAASEARQARMHHLHAMLAAGPPAADEALDGLVTEHLRLMAEEGLPLIWGRAGVIHALVRAKNRGDTRAAAAWAAEGASAVRLALGDDARAFDKLEGLHRAFATVAGDEGEGAHREVLHVADAVADAVNAVAEEDDDQEQAPGNALYEVGSGHEKFERAPEAAGWDAAALGPRVLHFSLLSHRRRWAQRLWPAGQILARALDESPSLVTGRSVLEIGAGAALPSVVAGLLGAAALVVSDYPDARMLDNMRANVRANLSAAQRTRTVVVGYDWKTSPHALLDELAALQRVAPVAAAAAAPPRRFDLILLADLLYECEHEPILAAVAACLAPAASAADAPAPRALLTFQVHDRCQLARQMAFFDLAPDFGLAARRLRMVTVGRQFDEDAEEGAEEDDEEQGAASPVDEEDDVTAQVQLWELVHI